MGDQKLHPDAVEMLSKGGGWLLVEFGGNDRDEADGRAHELMQALEKSSCKPNMKLLRDPDQQRKIWEVREAGLGATAHVPGQPDTWGGWEDASVAPDRVGAYLREFRALLDRYGYGCSLYGHFGGGRSEEHTSELQSLMRISSAVFCLKKKKMRLQRIHCTLHGTTTN